MSVANFLNFSRAAEHLHISQPAVSHQINTLEDELGVKLFSRTSKSVRLTQEGYLFIQYAGEILKISDLSKARMKDSRKHMARRLVIGCRNTIDLQLLQPALRQMRETDQAIMPVLRMIPFDSLENLLEEGEIHVIFSFGKGNAAKLRYQELTRCPVVCTCSPSHPLASCKELTIAELKRAGRIAICRPPICPPALFAVQSQVMGDRGPDQVLFCDSQEAAYTLTEAGYAFALAADFPHIRRPQFCYIQLPEFEPLSFGAVYAAGEHSSVIRQLLKVLEATIQM